MSRFHLIKSTRINNYFIRDTLKNTESSFASLKRVFTAPIIHSLSGVRTTPIAEFDTIPTYKNFVLEYPELFI